MAQRPLLWRRTLEGLCKFRIKDQREPGPARERNPHPTAEAAPRLSSSAGSALNRGAYDCGKRRSFCTAFHTAGTESGKWRNGPTTSRSGEMRNGAVQARDVCRDMGDVGIIPHVDLPPAVGLSNPATVAMCPRRTIRPERSTSGPRGQTAEETRYWDDASRESKYWQETPCRRAAYVSHARSVELTG
ncbi:hypothetical protein BP5796_01026 [Coleophoma crateriformis]|uniref:Uncharacterized protein n=1 Tax=Coleophoma crateriformis TaxID=565419 RepID=A0A3D8T9N0_9HELO|nr:hypothetical protein BP5796_01026 [Coleophoma crateriformis]